MGWELVLLNIKQILFYNVRAVFIFRDVTGCKLASKMNRSGAETVKYVRSCLYAFFTRRFNSNYCIRHKYIDGGDFSAGTRFNVEAANKDTFTNQAKCVSYQVVNIRSRCIRYLSPCL